MGGPDEDEHPRFGLDVGSCTIREVGCCAQWRPVPPLATTSSSSAVAELWGNKLRNGVISIRQPVVRDVVLLPLLRGRYYNYPPGAARGQWD